ncbi:unnamed protein product [Arabidopsis lyrata]|nr:unnamed protein product [Arabidopsis lyrata]
MVCGYSCFLVILIDEALKFIGRCRRTRIKKKIKTM